MGPAELRRDPYLWPPCCKGWVVSAVLGANASDMLVIMVYLDVRSAAERAEQIQEIHKRTALADLPAVIMGDFNCEPHDPELEPLELAGYAH
jgi:endonuclease/exonuclease/phosphatase family metal-dependent hydrolase